MTSRRLWACAAERRTGRKEHAQILVGITLLRDPFGRREESAQTCPQSPHKVGDAVQICVNKDFSFHQAAVVRSRFHGPRIRCGRCSSSSWSPTASFKVYYYER